jgi:SNF2 family DNA or RNA helicase
MKLIEKCPICGKIAKEVSNRSIPLANGIIKKFIYYECKHFEIKTIAKGISDSYTTMMSQDWDEKVKNCNHEFPTKEECELNTDLRINQCNKCNQFKLYDYQIQGAEFVETAISSGTGSGIFDEMGLGKTVQSLAYLKFHPEVSPVLFIVKSKIKLQWAKEIYRWLGIKHFPQIITSSTDAIIPGMKSYIIAFDMLVGRSKTKKVKNESGFTYEEKTKGGFPAEKLDFIKTVVIDEVQQIKNTESERTKRVLNICRDKTVIALSATPWKNRGGEFFVVLNLLAPTKFTSYQGFLDDWVDFYYDGAYTKQGGLRKDKIELFKDYVKDIIIRREVTDVDVEFPSVNRTIQLTELDALEMKAYEHETSEFVRWYTDAIVNGEEDTFEVSSNILAKLARMRHITGLAKIPATIEFAEEFYEMNDRKLVIFVHHKDVGDILYKEMRALFPKLLVLKDDQPNFESKFQDSRRAFLIASTLASGEGLNLQTCGDAILHERQWNPQNEDQAAPGRFRRIGATHKTVNVTFMTAAGTVDEILAEIVERKRAYFHNAMNKGEMPEFVEKSMAKELAEGILKAFAASGKKSITKMASLNG